MEPIVISLETNPEFWREMYFANGNGSLLDSQRVKWSYRYFILCSFLVILFWGLYIYDHSFIPGLWGAALFFIICSVDLYRKLKVHYAWRKKVLEHLKGFNLLTKYDLILSNESLDIITNISQMSIKWSSIKKMEKTKKGLRIYSHAGYFPIPQKAMTDNNFDRLFSFIESQLANSVYEPPTEEPEEYKVSKWSN